MLVDMWNPEMLNEIGNHYRDPRAQSKNRHKYTANNNAFVKR